MESSRTVFIYGLNDPRTGKCRYVGKASNCRKRWQAHIDRCRGRATHKNCWIKGLLLAGLKPVLEILDEVPDSEWQFWEREYIRVFRAIGFDLTNTLPGGEGLPVGHEISEETRAKMSAARLGKKFSNETKRNMSRAQRGRTITKSAREKIGDANRGKQRSPEAKQLIRIATTRRARDPQTGRLI